MHERMRSINEEIMDFIGEKAVVEHGILIFSFLNEHGESRTGYISLNNPDIQQTLGMMELTKSHIVFKQGDLSDDS